MTTTDPGDSNVTSVNKNPDFMSVAATQRPNERRPRRGNAEVVQSQESAPTKEHTPMTPNDRTPSVEHQLVDIRKQLDEMQLGISIVKKGIDSRHQQPRFAHETVVAIVIAAVLVTGLLATTIMSVAQSSANSMPVVTTSVIEGAR